MIAKTETRPTSAYLAWCLVMLTLWAPSLACRALVPGVAPTPTRGLETQPLPTPEVQPGAPSAGAAVIRQEDAVLPGERGDLVSLGGAPRYDLRLDVDFPTGAFTGSARVDYTNQEEVPLDRIYFRLLPNGGKSYGKGWLKVTRTALDGKTLEPRISLSNTVLELPLASALPPGDHLVVEFEFQGQVPLEFGRPDDPSGYGIYNLSDGVLALSGWYPILAVYDEDGWNLDPVSLIGDSVYSDTGFYTLELTAPEELVIAATGVEAGAQSAGAASEGAAAAGKLTRRYLSGPARDFFLVMSPRFLTASEQVGGTRVTSYFLPGHDKSARQALSVAAGSLSAYTQRFGAYPYTELDVVDAPMRSALGVEYPGVYLIASDLYVTPDDPSFDVAVAHETAHQWWYSVVGNDVFDDPWLDEGLTTYTSSLYFESAERGDAYQGLADYWQEGWQDLRLDGEDDVVTRSLGYFEGLGRPRIYGTVVYTKAALFFKALREEIGDEAFFSALKSYFQEFKYRTARPEDLLAIFESAAGRPLDAFFEEWLYQAQE